ncbi:MAG: hypothetical protein LBE75_07145 [Burkholderiales bacterium]|nr:hypothetical protein [Burkholderiales bacterium]
MKTSSFFRWLCCALFPALIVWGSSVHAAPIPLPSVPLGTEARVPPNIFMTVDDSASMLRTYNPDNLSAIQRACWTALNTIGICAPYDESVGAQTNPGAADTGWSGVNQATSLFHYGHPPLLASAFNGQAYDPLIEYRPPKRADGTFLPEMNAANTTVGGNAWAQVQWREGATAGTTATWPGRPLFNFRTSTLSRTQTDRNILSTRYMVNGDFTVFDSYRRSGTTGNSSVYDLPPHYYKTSVKWCNALKADGSANPGTLPAFSNCQDEPVDPGTSFPAAQRFIYPYYYAPFGEYTGRADNASFPAFELVILDFVNQTVNRQSSITHHFYNEETGAMDSFTRSFSQEAQNFANWAAYYKNRLVATKTAASHAFADIDSSSAAAVIPRVGFSSINRLARDSSRVAANSYRDIAVNTLSVAPFQGTQRNNFFDRLLGFRYTWAGTPLQVSLIEVGEMFRGTGTNAPIIHACQRNYHILFTDGMWNVPPTTNNNPVIGNVDNTVPSLPHLQGISVYGNTLSSGAFWPNPIRDHKGASLTLADIALYYWMTDLRPSMNNEVLWTNRDPASWQHLNFVGMGYGVRGTLPSKNQAATLARMGSGATDSNTLAWPVPVEDSIHNVDDLWHASINGFGRYVSAQSPDEFRAGLRAVLAEILNMGGARSGVGFTGTDLRAGDKFTYSVDFSPGWNGNVVRKGINAQGVETGVEESAATNLSVMLAPAGAWEEARQVFTSLNGRDLGDRGVPFVATPSLPFASSPLIDHLGATTPRQANAIAYLRGDRSREGDALGQFRVRGEGPLGDIVNAKPVAYGTPLCAARKHPNGTPVVNPDGSEVIRCDYDEDANPGYRQFYETHKTRGLMVYAAANDGMLHAFDKDLKEQWAYIPSDLFRSQSQAGIVNLTFQESNPNTPFRHFYYVDATPRVTDVDFISTPEGSRDWRTVLIGGLGKGGTSYYALDVTHAGRDGTEATTAQKKVLWEYTHKDMGYTYGRPLITKTRAWGYMAGGSAKNDEKNPGGTWVAILPSGYNNGSRAAGISETDIDNPLYQPKADGSGEGCLFFIEVATGNPKRDPLCTGVGTPDDPSGLVSIGGYVHHFTNQVTMAVYAGDQKGNFWRFNLESENDGDWTVERMAYLKDGSGREQWVTAEPWPQRDSKDQRWVFIGTGGHRNNVDLSSTDVGHTFYAFRDGGINDGGLDTIVPDFPHLVTDKRERAELTPITGLNPPTGGVVYAGWYQDAEIGYHFDVRPVSIFDVVVYAANRYVGNLPGGGLAGADPCTSAAFIGRTYGRNMKAESILFGGAHFETFSSGVADISLVQKLGDRGRPVLAIAVTSRDGRGLYEFKPELNIPLTNAFSGIPVRGGVRYISIND